MQGVDRIRHALDSERGTPVAIALRAARRYSADGMPDRAASLGYYGILSLFPSLLLAVSVIRLIGGSDAPAKLAEFARDHGSSGALSDALRSATSTAVDAPAGAAGTLGAVGLITLIYGASRAFTAAGRALDVTGGRAPLPRSPVRRLKDIGWTVVLVLNGIVVLVLFAVSGGLLSEFLELFGLSGLAVTVWQIARWPAAALLLFLASAVVRWAAPTASESRFRLVSPGAFVTVAIWMIGSAGFAIYVSEMASYNATYGAFAGFVILMLWIWLSSGAFLYGAEVDVALAEESRP